MTASRARVSVLEPSLLERRQVATGITTLLDFALMIALVETARLTPPEATLVSACFGGVVSFALARAWAHGRPEPGRYAAVAFGGAVLNAGLLALALHTTGTPYVLGRAAAALLIAACYTYPLHARFVIPAVARAQAASWAESSWLAAPFLAYAVYTTARSDLRVEQVVLTAIVVALSFGGPRPKDLCISLYPFGLVAVMYDAMRPFQTLGVTPSRVLLCGLRDVESRLFGWSDGGVRFTLHDFFLVHHSPALDLFCAIPYAAFLLWPVAGAMWLYVKDRPAMKRVAWGFFVLNVLGFITYHALPAAPPWYFHTHGCVVDVAAHASTGPALARVDARFGMPIFQTMYSRASSVFGALPSLHCAYPLLLVLEGWRAFGTALRVATIGFWLWMVFSAVYLDHHWLIDALLGDVYAVIAWIGVGAVWRRVHAH